MGGELTAGPGPAGGWTVDADHPPAGLMISVAVVDDDQLVRSGVKMILETAPDIAVIGEAVRRGGGDPFGEQVEAGCGVDGRPHARDRRHRGHPKAGRRSHPSAGSPSSPPSSMTSTSSTPSALGPPVSSSSGSHPMNSSRRFVRSPRAMLCSLRRSPDVSSRCSPRRATGTGPIRRVGEAHRAGA